MLLVGSEAVAQCFPDMFHTGSEWDLWVTERDLATHNVDLHSFAISDFGDLCASLHRGNRFYRMRLIPDGDVRQKFITANLNHPLVENDEGWAIHIASPASIALIQRAFLYSPTGWHRHIQAYHILAAHLGQTFGSKAELRAYFALRTTVLTRMDTESDPDFTMRVKNEIFFKDFKYPWLRVHEHDELHQTTCYGEKPIYQQLKEDHELAYVPKSRFEQLSHTNRIRLVREECYALALERVLIPAEDAGIPWDENQGFQHALRRICTTLARGWFRDFAIDNYPEVSRYRKPFLNDYHRALATGELNRIVLPISDEARKVWLLEYLNSQLEKDRDAAMDSLKPSQLSSYSQDNVKASAFH